MKYNSITLERGKEGYDWDITIVEKGSGMCRRAIDRMVETEDMMFKKFGGIVNGR